MCKIFSTVLIIFTLFFTVTGQLTAGDRLNGPVDFIDSPANRATGGLFSTDADNYIKPSLYKDIDMIKEIIVVSFHDMEFGTFGYGRYFGNFYAAIYYGGNMFTGYFNDSHTVVKEPWESGSKKFNAYNAEPVIDIAGNNNRFAFLAGTEKMGFRFSYASTLGHFNSKDITFDRSGSREYFGKYSTALGWIIPELQWGITSPLTKRGIQPTVTSELGIKREYTRNELYDTAAGFALQNETVENSLNFFQPMVSVDMGGISVFSKPAFDAVVNFTYSFCMRIYSNDYNYEDAAGRYKIKSIKGLNSGGVLTENSFMKNALTPSIRVAFNGMERLVFRGELFLPLLLVTAGETAIEIKPGSKSGELQKQSDELSLLAFQFSPLLKVGFQYQIVPRKLDLSIGGAMQFASITKAAANDSVFTNYGEWNPGSLPGADSAAGVSQSSRLFAGLTFMFNEKTTLDAMTDFNINNTGQNLAALFGILLSLKI